MRVGAGALGLLYTDAVFGHQEARDTVVRPNLFERGRRGSADVHSVWAARVEAAAARRVVKRRRAAGDAHALGSIVDLRQRANQVLGNPYGNKTVNNFLNPAAFRLPALGTLGNMGAGGIEGPGSWVIDTGISRLIQVREAQKLELRFEAFNVFNHFRMTDPVMALNSPLLGKVTSAQDPRIWQFALKYLF